MDFFFVFLILFLPWVKNSSLPDIFIKAIAPLGAGLIVWGIFGPLMQFAQYHAWPAIKLTDDMILLNHKKVSTCRAIATPKLRPYEKYKQKMAMGNCFH